MEYFSKLGADFVDFTNHHEPYIIAMRIFFTISAILVLLGLIPLTREFAKTAFITKYRIIFLWLWKVVKGIYFAHHTIFLHLVMAKENIFTGLDKEIKAEEDKKRNRAP